MIVARIAASFLSDRLPLRHLMEAASLLALISALALLLFPAASLFSLAALGFAMGPIWPAAVRMAAAALRSDALTASVLAAGGLGAAAGPLLGSLFLAGGRAPCYFPAILGLCLSVAAIIMIASRPRRRK
jgi:fucose permease